MTAPGHLSWSGRARARLIDARCVDNQPALLPRIRGARAVAQGDAEPDTRRALYAACDRAPWGWENRHG